MEKTDDPKPLATHPRTAQEAFERVKKELENRPGWIELLSFLPKNIKVGLNFYDSFQAYLHREDDHAVLIAGQTEDLDLTLDVHPEAISRLTQNKKSSSPQLIQFLTQMAISGWLTWRWEKPVTQALMNISLGSIEVGKERLVPNLLKLWQEKREEFTSHRNQKSKK